MDQFFHNDNSYNTTPPEYVGLLCERPARSGGISHVISFYTVHNELLRTHPEVLPRLYQPFWFDRQKEYGPEDPHVIREPMFSYDGRLRARLGLFQIQSGYTLQDEPHGRGRPRLPSLRSRRYSPRASSPSTSRWSAGSCSTRTTASSAIAAPGSRMTRPRR